jgi:hypothetical protein
MKSKDVAPIGMPGFFDQMRNPGNTPSDFALSDGSISKSVIV